MGWGPLVSCSMGCAFQGSYRKKFGSLGFWKDGDVELPKNGSKQVTSYKLWTQEAATPEVFPESKKPRNLQGVTALLVFQAGLQMLDVCRWGELAKQTHDSMSWAQEPAAADDETSLAATGASFWVQCLVWLDLRDVYLEKLTEPFSLYGYWKVSITCGT